MTFYKADGTPIDLTLADAMAIAAQATAMVSEQMQDDVDALSVPAFLDPVRQSNEVVERLRDYLDSDDSRKLTTSQHACLAYLMRHNGQASVGDLAEQKICSTSDSAVRQLRARLNRHLADFDLMLCYTKATHQIFLKIL